MHLTDNLTIRKRKQHEYRVQSRDTDDDMDDDDDLDAENEDIAIEEDKESDATVPTTDSLERDEVKQNQIVDMAQNLGTNITEQLEHPKSANFLENSNNVTANATQNATEKSSGTSCGLLTELSQCVLLFIVLRLV